MAFFGFGIVGTRFVILVVVARTIEQDTVASVSSVSSAVDFEFMLGVLL